MEKYGITLNELARLGDRLVRIDVHLAVPPDVYPKARRLQQLLGLSPEERRSRVRAWRKAECERLCREFPFQEFKIRRFNRDPAGISAVVPARLVVKLRELRHADGISVREIRGLRRGVRHSEPSRLYAVKGRLAFVIEGQRRGLQRLEERIVVVVADSEKKAVAKARRLMASHTPYLSTTGHLLCWMLDGIVDVCECPDQTFDPRGTEVFYEYGRRRLTPDREWHPASNPPMERTAKTRGRRPSPGR